MTQRATYEIQTRVARSGSEAAVSTQELVAQVALDLMVERREIGIPFGDVVKVAHVSRATAYRVFPGGMPSVLAYLHAWTVHDVIAAIESRTKALPREVTFEEAVAAGVSGVLDGLRESPWPAKVLRTNRDLMTSYLLGREPGGIWEVLSEYITRCAVNFGASGADPEEAAADFVWGLLSQLLCRFPAGGVDTPWPDLKDDARMQEYLRAPLGDFMDATHLPRGTSRLSKAAPVVRTPDLIGAGLPIITT